MVQRIRNIGVTMTGYVMTRCKILNKDELINLKKIKIVAGDNGKTLNLSELGGFSNLEVLNLYVMNSNISFSGTVDNFGSLDTLKYLSFYGYTGNRLDSCLGDYNISTLGSFSNLEKLDLSNNGKITYIPSGLTKLSSVNLSYTGIDNLRFCTGLENLKNLDLSYCSSLSETGFYKVESSVVNIDNMQVLADLNSKNLNTIKLLGTNITDFSKIKDLNWLSRNGF